MNRSASSDQEISGPAYLRLVLLGALIGIPAALVAAVFLAFVNWLEDRLWDDLPDLLGYASPPWFLVIALPVLGAGIVVAARHFLPGDGGHQPLEGIGGKPTPFRYGPSVVLAAIGTLAFGAVLGPEAPLIALGSVVGLAVAPLVRPGPKEEAVIGTAGSFSAVSALFDGPLVAGILLLEASVGLGAAAIPVLLPGLVAAAIGYLIFIGFGDWGGLDQTSLTVPDLPAYDGTAAGDLLVALAVGIAAAVVILGVRRLGYRVDGLNRRFGIPVLLIAGGLAVGLLAELAEILGGDSQDVLFSGQDSVPALIAEDSAWVVLVLLVAKALAYSISLGCGFRGGPVFPSIFLGVALATFAVIIFDVSPTLAVAVGTAAGMAAMTRLLFAPVLFAALLVGRDGLDAIPAAVLAAVAAWLIVNAVERRAQAEAESDEPVAPAPAAGS
jgi:chloride channel protein, CIC family